jgi:hypothetical protein
MFWHELAIELAIKRTVCCSELLFFVALESPINEYCSPLTKLKKKEIKIKNISTKNFLKFYLIFLD